MGSLCRCIKKTYLSLKNNLWSILFYTVPIVSISYPIIMLATGDDSCMDIYLTLCPFLASTVIFIVWLTELPLQIMSAEIFALIAYIIVWAVNILLSELSLYRKIASSIIWHLIFIFEIVANIVMKRYSAIGIDVLIVSIFYIRLITTHIHST